MTLVTSDNRLRYTALGKVRSENRLRYSNFRVSGPFNRLRYSCVRTVRSQRRLRYQARSQEFERIWQTGQASDPNSLPQVSIKIDGTEICPAPNVFQVTHSESGPARWTLGIEDPYGYYHPENASSPWFGKIVRNKSIVVAIVWEGAEYHLSGKVKSYGHTRNFTSAGSFDFTCSGLDNSGALFRTGVTLPSIRSSRADGLQTTKTAAASLLDAAGIAYNLDMMEATNIRLQHRQDGRPGDFFQNVLDVLHHEWIMIGDTLYVYLPNWFGPPQWTYGTDALIYEDSLQNDAPTMVNAVRSRRAKETNAGPGGAPDEHLQYGQFTKNFNPPLEGVYWKKTEQGGRFSDFRLYNNGALYAVREARGTYTGGEPGTNIGLTDKIVYTWGAPGPENTATSGYGKIQFLGAAKDREDQGWPADDQIYSVSRQNKSSLDAGDDLNLQELSANTLMPDAVTLERHADGLLRKYAAEPTRQDFRIPLNLLMFPGQSSLIVDPILGTKKRYIREVTQSIGTDLANCFTRKSTVYFDPNLVLEDVPEE